MGPVSGREDGRAAPGDAGSPADFTAGRRRPSAPGLPGGRPALAVRCIEAQIEVRRSRRRRRTVSAYRDGDRIVVLIPATFSRLGGAPLGRRHGRAITRSGESP